MLEENVTPEDEIVFDEETPSESDDYDFFDDEDFDNKSEEEPEETEEPEEETTEETGEELDEEPFNLEELELKGVDGIQKVKDLTPDAVKERLQKGGDYDRVKIQNSGYKETIDRFDYVSKLFDRDTNELLDELIEQHINREAEESGRHIDDVRKDVDSHKSNSVDKALDKLIENFPEIDIDNLPEGVTEAIKNGESPTQAYKEHQRGLETEGYTKQIAELNEKYAKLEKENKILKKNDKNRKSSQVKKTSDGEKLNQDDDFLKGFL